MAHSSPRRLPKRAPGKAGPAWHPFERLTGLAARALDAPLALVAQTGGERLLIRQAVGLSDGESFPRELDAPSPSLSLGISIRAGMRAACSA